MPAKQRKPEPLQAVVNDTTGLVENVIVCDQATADLFNDMDPSPFPGATLIECGGLGVRIGYTYAEERDPQFRSPQPSPDATWNEDTRQWDVPAPPEPEPEPEPAATGDGESTTTAT